MDAATNAGVATALVAHDATPARTVGYSHAPPAQHARKTPAHAATVLFLSGCRPNVPSSRTLLMATRSVEPSCSSTASHRGNAPTSAGRDAPTMDAHASVMFWRSTALVLAARSKSSGSCEMPSESA